MNETHICDVCKNLMILGECYKCSGSGKVTLVLGLFPRTCPKCGGAKHTYRCTNYREHAIIQDS